MKPTSALDIALSALLRILRDAADETLTPREIAAQAVKRIERLGDEAWTDAPASAEPGRGVTDACD